MPSAATDLAAELFIHGTVAALVVEAVLHWVPVTSPAARFPYRVTVLLAPLVYVLLFAWLLPFRRDEWFQDISVFVSARWARLGFAGVDARSAGLALGFIVGTLLLVRDVGHATVDAWRIRRGEEHLNRATPPARVEALVATLSGEFDVSAPAIEFLTSPTHALHCRGWRRPRIVISSGTVDALDDEALRTALAHELAHINQHDVFRGWVLLALRALQPFNPFAQAVGRIAAHEMEWRADDRAAAATRAPLALARALVRCARHRGDQFLGLSGAGRFRTLETRCRRLMRGGAPPEVRWTADLALLWIALGVLFVVVQ